MCLYSKKYIQNFNYENIINVENKYIKYDYYKNKYIFYFIYNSESEFF